MYIVTFEKGDLCTTPILAPLLPFVTEEKNK